MHGERLYKIWASMKHRCSSACIDKNREWYYEKGIRVGKEWSEFIPFMNWAIDNGYSSELTIDRIDNSIGYMSSNCRWVNMQTQLVNRTKLNTNTSGYIGVTYRKNRDHYTARISNNFKRIYIGSYKTALEACVAYNDYIDKHNLENTRNEIWEEE